MGTCFHLFGATTTMMKLRLMVAGLLMAALAFETTVGWWVWGTHSEDFDVQKRIGIAEDRCKGWGGVIYKACYNWFLNVTVKDAENFLKDMAEKAPKAREVIKELNKAMFKCTRVQC